MRIFYSRGLWATCSLWNQHAREIIEQKYCFHFRFDPPAISAISSRGAKILRAKYTSQSVYTDSFTRPALQQEIVIVSRDSVRSDVEKTPSTSRVSPHLRLTFTDPKLRLSDRTLPCRTGRGQTRDKMARISSSSEHTACLLVLLMAVFSHIAQAIDCYKCTSIDGKVEDCEDDFDRGISTVHLISRECVYGYFKGTHCIKLKGLREDGVRITVRDCSDGDWGSHCGDIRYLYGNKQQKIDGCLEACDHDGCNPATTTALGRSSFLMASLFLVLGIKLVMEVHRLWRAISS
ncbi:hypothetical protein RRG08_020921 [Elysia crispata]|uniref:Protein sleepless n=1 Tax=Elysia crispata TaxID=231223 RepID=A0AAE1DY27_9GAST|nr:hypothetical protein RRG08_020921 [Elysia crispata]